MPNDESQRVKLLVGEILRADPVPPINPDDLVPITVPPEAPPSVAARAMEREDARLQRVRDHSNRATVGPMTPTFGSVSSARHQLEEIDPTLPAEMDRIGVDDGGGAVGACAELYQRNIADRKLWIAKGRPPRTPGWRDR